MNVGQRIREAREALGMQRTVLARRVGVAPNTLWRYEAGHSEPSVAMMGKIARELRTEPAEFLREPVPLGEASETGRPEEGERRVSLYEPWLEFVNQYADRWEQRIDRGDLNRGALDEFIGTLNDLGPILSRLGQQEKHERPEESKDYTYGVIIGEAMGRLMSLLTPLIEASAKQDEGSDLARLRRQREEMLNEQARASNG